MRPNACDQQGINLPVLATWPERQGDARPMGRAVNEQINGKSFLMMLTIITCFPSRLITTSSCRSFFFRTSTFSPVLQSNIVVTRVFQSFSWSTKYLIARKQCKSIQIYNKIMHCKLLPRDRPTRPISSIVDKPILGHSETTFGPCLENGAERCTNQPISI